MEKYSYRGVKCISVPSVCATDNEMKTKRYSNTIGAWYVTIKTDEKGLLDNTVVIIYGDHDAKIKKSEYEYFYNYDPTTGEQLSEDAPDYHAVDYYEYELNRKVPFIIWTKDMEGTDLNKTFDYPMGMYDLAPTLENMFGFYNKYALGRDIFNIKENNLVVFLNGNWVTNKVYYNSQKGEYLSLTGEAISEEEIKNNKLTIKDNLTKEETKVNIDNHESTLAIVGPKRMEYDKVVSLLDYIKNNLKGNK